MHKIYKCDRGPHNTTWRTACVPRVGGWKPMFYITCAVYITLLQCAGVKFSAQHYTNVKKEIRFSLQVWSASHTTVKYNMWSFTTACRRPIYGTLYPNAKCWDLLRPAGVRFKAQYIELLHIEVYHSLQASDIRHRVSKCYMQRFREVCSYQVCGKEYLNAS